MVSISNIGREIPELETDRSRLRGHCLEDFEDCFALWSDPDGTRAVGLG